VTWRYDLVLEVSE